MFVSIRLERERGWRESGRRCRGKMAEAIESCPAALTIGDE